MQENPKCAKCGFSNPPLMKFCGNCGNPLAQSIVEEEKRDVAILFADICDFTAMVSESDPEEIKTIIDEALKTMSDCVVTYNGVVDKFIGDAVMAVFGAPVAHENDSERAVRVGLSMLDLVASVGRKHSIKLNMRVGINCGEVIVSKNQGSGANEQHFFGETINIASRLEDSGVAGTVIVSYPVYKRTQAIFHFEELPPLQAKGIAEPIVRYRVLGEKTERGKLRGIEGLSAPMIGREYELDNLLALFEQVREEKTSRFAAIIGEAGIGKTRLVEEFLDTLSRSDETLYMLHGRCLGYAGAPPYLPFTQIIRKLADIREDMTTSEASHSLSTMLKDVTGKESLGEVDSVQVILQMLSLAKEERFSGGRYSVQIRDQVMLVMEDLLRNLALQKPIVLFVEDIHWADEATLTLIEHLTRTLINSACLFVLNSRPPDEYNQKITGFLEAIQESMQVSELKLKDLTGEQSRELIRLLLNIDELSQASRDFIVERSGGNPFFVEEIIKVLIEMGVIEYCNGAWVATRQLESLDVPDSIEGVLHARLDQLPRLEKMVIQRAAVIGRIFWRRIVSELAEQSIEEFLEDLENRDLIRERLDSIFEDDLEYIFKHALLHETVYNSMMRRVRQDLHRKTAQWIESKYNNRLEAHYPMVAFHYEMAGEKSKGAYYYLKAAQQAAALYANDNAQEYYKKASELAVDDALLQKIYLGWGELESQISENEQAINLYKKALELSVSKHVEAEVFRLIADSYEKLSSYTLAISYLEQAHTCIAGQPPCLEHAKILRSRSRIYYLQGDSENALKTAHNAEAILDELVLFSPEAKTVRAMVNNEIANAMERRSQFDEVRKYREETMRLYDELGNLFGVARTMNGMGIDAWNNGDYDTAIDYLKRSFGLSERCGNRLGQAIACNNLGELSIEVGLYDKAREYFELYLAINAAIANRLGDGYANYGLGHIAREKGEYELAEKYFLLSEEVYEEVAAWANSSSVRLSRALMYAESGNEDECMNLLGKPGRLVDDEELRITEALSFRFISRKRALTDEEKSRLVERLPGIIESVCDLGSNISTIESLNAVAELCQVLGETQLADELLTDIQAKHGKVLEGIVDKDIRESYIRRMKSMGIIEIANVQ